ncbi:hypothetical protein niasHT_037999 [Heterodera trifolii]|uniref:1-phosphatidylinositol-3-phosphate 5-kinase n=1 Tax=Heterodera trifolii TaxID=157864 RepID=A0ABD2HMU5_9BILA
MSSSSMVYFPVFDEPLEAEKGFGARTSDSSGIFSLFSNLFRPSNSSSFSRNDSSSSTIYEKMSKSIKTDEICSDQAHPSVSVDLEVPDFLTETDQNGLSRPSSNDLSDGPISLVRKRLIDYKKSEFRRFWMPDSAGNECYECNEKFSTFRRRHHCRLCGQLFCKNCARCQVNGTELGCNGMLRLCTFCALQVDAHISLRKERRETVKSFTQIDTDDVFIGVPIANSNNQENQYHLNYLKNAEMSVQLADSEQLPSIDPSSNAQCADGIPNSANRLELLFEQKLNGLLDSLMLREQLQPEWRQLLWSLSKSVTDRIGNLTLRNTETLNILDFLHIKKLHLRSDLAPNPCAEIVNGVAFSKSLAHSAMPSKLNNVSLMLLNGTIAYERVLEKFTSLEPMLSQERQYLRLQCDRVLSRRVSLLLTESSISPMAIDLLMAEGISVVANVKANVLLRVARASSADILSSLDAHFLQPRVGFVPEFCQREFTVAGGKCKRVLCFENGDGNFGVTVLLKGRSIRELVAAKRLLRFLVLSRFSSRLELSFLSMFDSVPRNSVPKRGQGDFHCHICELNARYNANNCNGNGLENDSDFGAADDFVRCLHSVHLSNSPAICFSVPFLATSIGRRSPLASFLRNGGFSLFHFLRSEDFAEFRANFDSLQQKLDEVEREEHENKMRNGTTIRHKCLDGEAMGGEPRKLLDRNGWISFRATSALHFQRRAELNRKAKEEKLKKREALLAESEIGRCELLARDDFQRDVLSPYNHQGIAFLYCANARRATSRRVEEASRIFCTGPYVLQRQFYHGKDTSLGAFLLNCCFNSDFKCKGCERPMLDHFRRIVHGNTRIEVVTRNVASGGGGGTFRNSSSSSLANAAVATVGPFVSGGLAAAIPSASSGGGDDELNRTMPLDELPSSIPNNNCSAIICWLRCNACSANSSIAKMTDEMFHLSFAKFVDYLANGSHWVSPFPSSIDLAECHHCTFHCHSHFFALGNFVARFSVNPIYPLNVLFAPIPCSVDTTTMTESTQQKTLSEIALRCTLDEKGGGNGTQMVPDVGSVIAHALAQPSESRHPPGREKEKGSFGSLGSFSATANNGSKFADFVDIVYAEENWQYTVKVYFPEQFERFRSLTFCDGEESFINSISASSPWYPQGGKSGAVFSRTDDERFVLKTLNRFELDAFKQSALKYIDYISMALMEGKLTALCKIFGAFSVNCTNKQTGQSVKSDLIVMEFLFYRKDIKQIWDLKGSLRNRLASTKSDNNGASSVLLDENYIQNMWRNQIYITTHSKTALSQAIINDSHFLADQGIMDYSLLAGICRGEEDEVIVGIVDYMRTFTFDKKVESAIKNAIPLTNSSTVISPEQYCRRFYEAIDGYFAVAPDQWTSESVFT